MSAQSEQRAAGRRWVQTDAAAGVSWDDLVRQAGGDEERASITAASLMYLHRLNQPTAGRLKLFAVWNSAKKLALVLAEGEQQARAVALFNNHIREFENGDCEVVDNCAERWGAGFASAVERAKLGGSRGVVLRNGNHAVIGNKVHSPLHEV